MQRLDPQTTQVLGLAWGFGWRITAGLFLGYYLDRWLGTAPLLLIAFTIGSFVAGIADFLRLSSSSLPKRPSGRRDDEAG